MSDTVALTSKAPPAGRRAGAPPALPLLSGHPAGAPVVRLWTPAPNVTITLARADSLLAAPEAVDRLRPEEYRPAAAMAAWRAREHLAGRALLRLLLAKVAGEEAARAPVVPEPAGRPRLPGSPGTGVSVSHSGPYAAAAVATGLDVGVDVQVPRPPSPAMLRRCCAPRTAARLASMAPEEAARAFAWVWTVQEACVKARGTGLAGAPWRVRAEPDGPGGTWGTLQWRRSPRTVVASVEPLALACAFGPGEPSPPPPAATPRRAPGSGPRP